MKVQLTVQAGKGFKATLSIAISATTIVLILALLV